MYLPKNLHPIDLFELNSLEYYMHNKFEPSWKAPQYQKNHHRIHNFVFLQNSNIENRVRYLMMQYPNRDLMWEAL